MEKGIKITLTIQTKETGIVGTSTRVLNADLVKSANLLKGAAIAIQQHTQLVIVQNLRRKAMGKRIKTLKSHYVGLIIILFVI